MKPLPAPPPPTPADVDASTLTQPLQRGASLALLAGMMLAIASPAEAQLCIGFGCKNYPKHDANSSDYHYPPPPPAPEPAPPPPRGDSQMNPPGKKPKPSCDFCHAGLPVSRETLPVDDRYFPASLLQDPPRFARVHQMAVSRTGDKRPYSKPKAVEQVPLDMQALFRAIARR